MWTKVSKNGGTGGGGGGASIAEDMYFTTKTERDQFTIDNPSRIFQGVTCAVENTSEYDYFQYDMANTQWRDANLIFQGPKGNQGEAVSVGDGTGSYTQVNKINFDEGLSIEVAGDVATVITEDPALLNVKSVDAVEPDANGNVQVNALRGRINVTNVDVVTLSAGDGISIEGEISGGGYTVVKHSNGLTLNGFCLDTDIDPGEDGNMFISGECACIELGLESNTPKGTKIYYDRLTAKLYTKLKGDGDNFYVGNFTDTSENVFVNASLMNSQYQSKLNYEEAINQLVNVIIPDEGKDFDAKFLFKDNTERNSGYTTGYSAINFEYNDKLQTEVAKAPSPYDQGQPKTALYAFNFAFDQSSFYQNFYLVVTDEQLLKMQTNNQDIGYEIGKLEYGITFGKSKIGMGKNEGFTPNPTYGGKIDSEGLVIPDLWPDDINVVIDPNNTDNTYFLNGAGDVVDKSSAKSMTYTKQPYYGDYKIQTRTNNPVYRTVSKSDLLGDDGKGIQEWVTENPGYTPIEFVDRLFSSKVLGYTNWEASITLSNETFNGTLPYGYTQFRVFRTGGSSRSFMYLHNKESHTVLYAPYKSGAAPIFRKIAYTDEVESIVSDTLNDLISPPEPDEILSQYVFQSDSEIGYGYKNGHAAINPFSYDDDYNRISYSYRNETSNGKRSLFQVLTIKDKSMGYMMLSEERLKEAMSNSGIYVPPNLQKVYGIRIQSGTMARMGGTGDAPSNATNGGKYDYRGLAIPNTNPNTGALIDPNRRSNDVFLDADGNLITDMSNAVSHFRTERLISQVPLGNAGEDMNFALKRGAIIFSKDGDKSDAFFVDDGNSPWYIFAVELGTVASSTEQYTVVIYQDDQSKSPASINLYPNPFIAALDGDALTTSTEVSSLIESNNDDIITPSEGSEFQLIDSDKSGGYGDNGSLTYYGPNYGGGQAEMLLGHLDNSKSYFVHEAVNESKGFALLHESYVSQIYNKDVSEASELTMIFGTKARGRYGKSGQTVPEGMLINWNGDYIPDTEDPNDLNPLKWIATDGTVTETWSKSGIKTPCYSVGVLANDGSAELRRGDVICENTDGVKTSRFVADNNSEFFVIPIRTGGGTFNDIKIFALFMSRYYQTQNKWESYTFNKSSDAIGTLLKIAYDAAIDEEESKQELEQDQLMEGLASGFIYAKSAKIG